MRQERLRIGTDVDVACPVVTSDGVEVSTTVVPNVLPELVILCGVEVPALGVGSGAPSCVSRHISSVAGTGIRVGAQVDARVGL